VTIALAPVLQQARLAATLAVIGSGARVLIYGGQRPIAGSDAATGPLAEVPLANPPGLIAGDKIVLMPADPAGVLIRRSGPASWTRIVAGDGQWLLDCDVGEQGDWQIRVDGLPEGVPQTQLYEGGTFVLGTVTLA
jgi:hypothetical protein